MDRSSKPQSSALHESQRPAIRFLVESALRKVISNNSKSIPRSRDEWVARLSEALMSESESSYQTVISSLVSSGVTTEEIYQDFVPATARYLGELWITDRASFVDVTVAASRLQTLFRSGEHPTGSRWLDRSVPLGQSVLMVIPSYEQHSLGAFVAADNLRRHGLWVHMAIALDRDELVEMLSSNRFAMIGISVSTRNSVEKTTELVDYVRANVDHVPPIVVGGGAVDDCDEAVRRTGADFAVTSAREAIEKCGLSSIAGALSFDGVI